MVKNNLTKTSFLWKHFRSVEVFHPLAKISTYDQHVHHEFVSTYRPQNLKNAEGCQVAGKPNKSPSELPDEVMAIIAETIGGQSKAVTRFVQEGQVSFWKTSENEKSSSSRTVRLRKSNSMPGTRRQVQQLQCSGSWFQIPQDHSFLTTLAGISCGCNPTGS